MNLVRKALDKLNGLHYRQEYLCLAKESFPQPIHAYLLNDNRIFKDITADHCFNGYNPVIFALHSLDDAGFDHPPTITIVFSHKSLQPNEIFSPRDAIARLSLKKIHQDILDDNTISYYEATHGSHHFVSSFYQFVSGVNNHMFNRKDGNVFLPGNLYKQVQVAYALPRSISVITVGQNDLYNIFPTDLHGPVGTEHYIISLRHEGKACQQVHETGRLCLSQVEASAFRKVYSLGKNHMKEMRPKEEFPVGRSFSLRYLLPIPEFATGYRELELMDYYNHGIHQLMLFEVVTKQDVTIPGTEHTATLAHIHNAYATWRYNNRLEGNYLLR